MKKTNEFRSRELWAIRELLHEKTGIWISETRFYQIFTRRSYTAQYGGDNNEVLEFVGDQVLAFYVTKAVMDDCHVNSQEGGYAFRLREAQVTAIRQKLVCNENLASIIDSWGIAEYIVVGESEWVNGLKDETKAKADLFEAILGDIAMQYKWDPRILEKAVRKMLSLDERLAELIKDACKENIIFDLDNAVQRLKEFAEKEWCQMPQYEFTGPEMLGYDQDGNPKWICECVCKNIRKDIINISQQAVCDKNKGIAKKTAAYLVLCDLFEQQNAYGPNKQYRFWHWRDGHLIPEMPWH